MIKEKYKQLCLFLQFGGIRTMEHTHTLGNMLKDDSTMKEAETEIKKFNNNMTDKLTGLDINSHSTRKSKMTISHASHFLKFLCQPAFGTFEKPHKPTHNQSFAKEPNFTPALGILLTMKNQLILKR